MMGLTPDDGAAQHLVAARAAHLGALLGGAISILGLAILLGQGIRPGC